MCDKTESSLQEIFICKQLIDEEGKKKQSSTDWIVDRAGK